MSDAGASNTSIAGMWPYEADILGDGPSTPRIRAISVVWAAQAGTFGEVIDFRRRFLEDTLLPADQVDTWLKTRPESTRPPALWLYNIPVERLVAVANGSYIIPQEVIAEAGRNHRDDNEEPSARGRNLIYATPDHDSAQEPIRATGGILDSLRTVALRLVEFHEGLWREEQAVTFVLTGYVPLVPGDAFPLPSRPGRRQTEKHLQLAVFTAQNDARGGIPFTDRMAEWNRRFPQWSYKQVTNFDWDSRQALYRLIPSDSPDTKDQQNVSPPSSEETAAAIRELNRQQGIEDEDEGAVWTAEIPQLLEDAKRRDVATALAAYHRQQRGKRSVSAKPEPEREYTAEEVAIAWEEKKRRTGRKSAVWGSEVQQLNEDAKRRDETKKTEKDVG